MNRPLMEEWGREGASLPVLGPSGTASSEGALRRREENLGAARLWRKDDRGVGAAERLRAVGLVIEAEGEGGVSDWLRTRPEKRRGVIGSGP